MRSLSMLSRVANSFQRITRIQTPFNRFGWKIWHKKWPYGNRYQRQELPVQQENQSGYNVSIDVREFKLNQLTVKVVDNSVVIEGKYEQYEKNNCYVASHFVRRYTLPNDYDTNKIVSNLSPDGMLTVNVPNPNLEKQTNERVIPIQHNATGQNQTSNDPRNNNGKKN